MKKHLLPLLVLLCIGCKKETNDDTNTNNGNNNTTKTITCRSVNSKTFNPAGELTADTYWYYTGSRPDSIITLYYSTSGTTKTRAVYEHTGNNECYVRNPDNANSTYTWQRFDNNYNVLETKVYNPGGGLISRGETTWTCD